MIIDQDKIDELKNNQPLDFSDALFLMKSGLKVRRRSWKDTPFIKIKKPTGANDGSSREAMIVGEVEGNIIANADFKSTDLLAEDWIIVE